MSDMVLADLNSYMGMSSRPDDFDAYWARSLAELNGTDYTLEDADIELPGVVCKNLYFIAPDTSRIHCKLVYPKNAENTPGLCVFHGYFGSSPDFFFLYSYAALGFTVIALDARGQAGISEDKTVTSGSTINGHIIRGYEDGAYNLLFRRIYTDTVQCSRILASLPWVNADMVGAYGGSMGGALSLACTALNPNIRFAAVWAPFLCDFRRINQLHFPGTAYTEFGWHFRNVDPRHDYEEQLYSALEYIDISNLTPRIKVPVFWTLGFQDTTCPPSTQFAAYNRITSEKHMDIYPEFDHDVCGSINENAIKFIIKEAAL